MRLYWLVLIIPFLILSVMDVKKCMEQNQRSPQEPSGSCCALNLGLSVYALIVCMVLMILMMFGVIG